MSRFYASIQGNRGEATRQGSKDSGIHGHVRGWNIGASVDCFVDANGDDIVIVDLTSGSSGHKGNKCLGRFKASDLD